MKTIIVYIYATSVDYDPRTEVSTLFFKNSVIFVNDPLTCYLHIARIPRVGIGTKLMKKLYEVLRENGYTQTSLSVQKYNPAVMLYKQL